MGMETAVLDNAVRGRLNAWFFDFLESYMHRKYATIKSRLLAEVPPVLVELGPGAGANLRYFPRGTRLIAIEPNRHFHAVLRKRARQHGIDLDLRGLAGEALDVATASVDFVFSSLVLCSVNDPAAVLAEVRRVLKSGGRFVCVEHVPAPSGSANGALQRAIARPWKWTFEGCDLCRDTGGTLKRAGFSEIHIQPMIVPTMFLPIRHQITAMCVK
jgi:ubiquinone/menaquinone biosynthesis C-methylase UbiE